MTEKMRIRLMVISLALVLGSCVSVEAQELVSVKVVQKKDPAGVKYSYTVANQADREIVTVLIGENLEQGVPHLRSKPVGWSFEASQRVGYGWTIPGRGAAAPPGWIPMLVLFEESNEVALSWIVKDDQVKGVAPGETVGGFEVKIPRADSSFLKPPFTAIFADASSYSGTVQ